MTIFAVTPVLTFLRPVAVSLAAPVRAPADRDLYVRVRVREGRAWPLPGPSALIGDLSGADALVLCRAGMALDPGTAVAALPLG